MIAALPCFGTALPALGALLELNPDVASAEKGLESKIEQAIKTYLGDQSRVIARVVIKESVPGPSTRAISKDAGINIIYAPVPFISIADKSDLNARRSIFIKSVEAEIQVSGEQDQVLEGNFIADVKAIVERILKGFNAKISIIQLEIPYKKVIRNQNFLERYQLDLKSLLPVLSMIFAALILATGIGFVARSVKYSASTLADGFAKLSLPSQSTGSEINGSSAQAKTPEPQQPIPVAPAYSAAHSENYTRNFAIFKECLIQNPIVFLRALRDDAEELRGIKWILPSLSGEEQQSLKKYISRSGFTRFSNMAHLKPPADPMIWLQDFAERLMIRKVDERTIVDRALGIEKSGKLYLANPKHLVKAVRKVNSSGAWRILSEFVSNATLDRKSVV